MRHSAVLPLALSVSLLLTACQAQVLPPGSDASSSSSSFSLSSSISSFSSSSANGVTSTSTSSLFSTPLTGGNDVQYGRMGGTALHGFLATPEGDGAFPAVILIHEWWGLNDNMRDMARQFAEKGYVALAVDLYNGKSTKDQAEAQTLATAVRNDVPGALENLRQASQFLSARKDVNKQQIASVGWCFGGGWSYQMAKNDLGVKATVMYYGQFDPHDDFVHMKSSILGHFGEKDMSIKVDDVHQFEAALQTASGLHEVYIYPNAGHGFANPSNPSYDKVAAELAWERTQSFLQRALSL